VLFRNFGWWPCGAPIAAVLQKFFFHGAGAPFKAPASFNFSLKFAECRGRAVKKKHHKVVERWL
jgi:hypothetical protein